MASFCFSFLSAGSAGAPTKSVSLFKMGSHRGTLRPGTSYIDQAVTELIEILLFLPPSLDLKVCATNLHKPSFRNEFCLSILGSEPRALWRPSKYCSPGLPPSLSDCGDIISELRSARETIALEIPFPICRAVCNLSHTQAFFWWVLSWKQWCLLSLEPLLPPPRQYYVYFWQQFLGTQAQVGVGVEL